jgi:hypothetical protein
MSRLLQWFNFHFFSVFIRAVDPEPGLSDFPHYPAVPTRKRVNAKHPRSYHLRIPQQDYPEQGDSR